MISCAFNYDAHSTEFEKLGRVPILKAHMNADLHMADDLKTTSKGNLFVIFGEPDIDILDAADNQIQVKIKGVDVFHPNTGEVRSDGSDGIACWFIDSDYNEDVHALYGTLLYNWMDANIHGMIIFVLCPLLYIPVKVITDFGYRHNRHFFYYEFS